MVRQAGDYLIVMNTQCELKAGREREGGWAEASSKESKSV